MIHFAGKLNRQLNRQLELIEREEIVISVKARKSIDCIKKELVHLKTFIVQYKFQNIDEEILFFKEIKPEILSKLIYFVELFNIERHRPLGSLEMQRNYFQQELSKLTCFFNNNRDFYQYYRLKLTFLDDKLFVRGSELLHLYQNTLMISVDPDFSTSHDLIVAQILANDRLESYMNAEIQMLTFRETNPNWAQMGSSKQQTLQWTDSKTSLVELIYALYASGAINNGKCEIRELSAFFENTFNIRLPDVYRTFLEIKIRSTPTKFIDTLKASLLRKIDEDFE